MSAKSMMASQLRMREREREAESEMSEYEYDARAERDAERETMARYMAVSGYAPDQSERMAA